MRWSRSPFRFWLFHYWPEFYSTILADGWWMRGFHTPLELRQEIERMDRLGLKVMVTTDPRIVRAAELAGERP